MLFIFTLSPLEMQVWLEKLFSFIWLLTNAKLELIWAGLYITDLPNYFIWIISAVGSEVFIMTVFSGCGNSNISLQTDLNRRVQRPVHFLYLEVLTNIMQHVLVNMKYFLWSKIKFLIEENYFQGGTKSLLSGLSIAQKINIRQGYSIVKLDYFVCWEG